MADLRAIQKKYGYLPEAELRRLSRQTLTPLHCLQAVASFFPQFRSHPGPARELRVCTDVACRLQGSPAIIEAAQSVAVSTDVGACACLGQCDRPIAALVDDEVVAGLDAERVLDAARGCRTAEGTSKPLSGSYQIYPYQGEARYEALSNVVAGSIDPVAVLQAADLRGMGGAGFPTGRKWEIVRDVPAEEKFVICNADESEPGTFKDRFLLDHFADLVVEGLAVACAAVGACKGYVYIRPEYARETAKLRRAVEHLHATSCGRNVAIEIFVSPGGYICGEETALLEVIEGKRAEPRNRPPFPGTKGLWGKPTLINNVESLCWVPAILLRGADWYARQGVNGATGLRLVALSGHVNRAGVYEVPLGTRVIDLIEQQGQGMTRGRKLKAFTPGGASSGFLPAKLADTPLDFRALTDVCSMLGSGAVVAFAEETCLLDVAASYLRFFRNESCGKCVPCRLGTEKMTSMAERLSRGKSTASDHGAIEDLATAMELTSICGLGQMAPMPLRSLLVHFREEIDAHLRGQCPQGLDHA